MAHARALLNSTPEGATAYIEADARDTAAILSEAARTLDFSQPVAVMFLMTLQYIPDADQPHELVAAITSALPSGSFLVISDTTADIDASRVSATNALLNARMGTPQTRRTGAAIARFFDGLDLVDPGLVLMPAWRADPDPEHVIACYAAVGRKP